MNKINKEIKKKANERGFSIDFTRNSNGRRKITCLKCSHKFYAGFDAILKDKKCPECGKPKRKKKKKVSIGIWKNQANLIKDKRVKKKLSKPGLAKELGIHKTFIYLWEKGDLRVTEGKFKNIEKVLGIKKRTLMNAIVKDFKTQLEKALKL